MSRGILHCACWAVTAVLFSPGSQRGAPPNCTSCTCTDGVLAYIKTTYSNTNEPTTTGPYVLAPYDANKQVYGAAVPTALVPNTDAGIPRVYALNNKANNIAQACTTTYTQLIYTVTWPGVCTQGQRVLNRRKSQRFVMVDPEKAVVFDRTAC